MLSDAPCQGKSENTSALGSEQLLHQRLDHESGHIWWFSESPISFSTVSDNGVICLKKKIEEKFPALVVTEIRWKERPNTIPR